MQSASPADTALVVVNLGTPDAPTAPAVRRYLAEFLGDPRGVSIPPLLWKPLLYGLILPLRGPRSAANYAKVWLEEGSPLLVHTTRLAAAIGQRIPEWRVVPAMRYGKPSLRALLRQLRESGVRRLVVLPLYPLFSFHGIPQRLADNGDPYPQRCRDSAAAIAAALGLEAGQWSLSYQSRFGRERWLEPSPLAELDRLAGAGVREVDVVCPGFAVDCIETLEEVAMGLAEHFAGHGGRLRYIPCLNDAPAHADALARLARRAAGA